MQSNATTGHISMRMSASLSPAKLPIQRKFCPAILIFHKLYGQPEALSSLSSFNDTRAEDQK